MSKKEEKKEEKKDKDQSKDKKNEDKKKTQIKLRVFEEDDYFEEFEEGKLKFFLYNNTIIYR